MFQSRKTKILAGVMAVLMFFTACSSNWVPQAIAIVNVLVPAAANILLFVSQMQGKTVSPQDAAFIAKWSAQAQNDFKQIGSLIDQWNLAVAADKPGVMAKIETAMSLAQSNLDALLPALHITDEATVTKIKTAVTLLSSEMQSLLSLVQLAQGKKMTVAHGGKPPMKAGAFKKAFNKAMLAHTGNAAVDAAAAKAKL